MINMEIVNKDHRDIGEVKRLYDTAFPLNINGEMRVMKYYLMVAI